MSPATVLVLGLFFEVNMARAKKVNAPSIDGDQSVGPKFVSDGEKFKVITSSGIEETDFETAEEAALRVDALNWYERRLELMQTATGEALAKLELAVPFDDLEG